MTDRARLLPPNATPLELAVEQALAPIGDLAVAPVATLWDPWSCPSAFLPILAWSVSVDVWDPNWSEAVQRQVIAASPQVHRLNGTRGAVNRAIAALNSDILITEWFDQDPPGAPFTFIAEVAVSGLGVNEETEAQIIAVITAAKNERSHMSALSLLGMVAGVVRGAAALGVYETVRLQPAA